MQTDLTTPKLVQIDDAHSIEERDEKTRNAWPPTSAYLFDWLKTEQGIQVVESAAGILDALKKRALEQKDEADRRAHSRETIHIVARYGMLIVVIAVATGLTWFGKLDNVMIGLLASSMGYVFGRQVGR